MKDCDGEVKSIGLSSISDPVIAGLIYMDQCMRCVRWCGSGSHGSNFSGEWVSVQFLGEEGVIMICKSSVEAGK